MFAKIPHLFGRLLAFLYGRLDRLADVIERRL